jgi:two-component system cell cycle sensor histidine kinase/response regulator CckA
MLRLVFNIAALRRGLVDDRRHDDRSLQNRREKYFKIFERLGRKARIHNTVDGCFWAVRWIEKLMNQAAKILVLEDSPADLQLLRATLTAQGLQFRLSHARTGEEFREALQKDRYDLVISDFSLPGYDGLSALALSKEIQRDTPFVFLSGTIGEERAVESLKMGAADYVLKDRPARLSRVVERALREAREQRERAVLEEQLHQAQKMEAIGQLAGGIAHDFNNLLQIMRGNTELVLRYDNRLTEKSQRCLRQVTMAAERATNLIRQLLTFSRKQVGQFQRADLDLVIGNLAQMLRQIIGEHIVLKTLLAENLPVIQADVGMIEQALINLVVNARDAMPNGGSISISTGVVDIDDEYITDHPAARTGEFVRIAVADTGGGIPEEYLTRIFEPFFTTKEVGKGTGLGLAMVYGAMKQHKGWVEVSSRVKEGSTFTLYLPVDRSTAGIGAVPSPGESDEGGNEGILLVEDDPAVREFVREVLASSGYRIYEAGDGNEASRVWGANMPQIDLLLTDMVMPGGINGGQLAKLLKEDRPGLKVIFMSGYDPEFAGKVLPPGFGHFIQKPCSTDALTAMVRSCLDGKPDAVHAVAASA